MKYSIFFLLVVLSACSFFSEKSVKQLEKPIPADSIPNEQEVRMEVPNFHYVVRFEFTDTEARMLDGTREEGSAPLMIIPSRDMFMAVYEGENLVFYFDFPNPLQQRGIDREGADVALEKGTGTLIFPAWLRDTEERNYRIEVIKVQSYVENFRDAIRTLSQLKMGIQEGQFKRQYQLNTEVISQFLKNIPD